MKTMVRMLVLAIAAVPAFAMAVNLIDFAPATVFTPVGFDSNDNAQIVLDGTFANTCYKVAEPVVSVDRANMRIDVRDKAFYHKGSICLYMLVPYFKTVNLGVLNAGKYSVYVHEDNNPPVKAGALEVVKATNPNPDDYLYAPVEEASMDQTGVDPVLTLKGTFTKSCYRVKEIRVTTFTTPNSMIEVLPIAEEDGSACLDTHKEFSEQVVVKGAPTGRVLLHIRSLNGQALNRVLNM